MKLCECPLQFSIPTGSDNEQRALFASFRQYGYSGLQLKGGQYARYIDCPEKFIGEWGADKAAFGGIIVGGGLDKEGIASLRRAIEFAEAIKAALVIFCHGRSRNTVNDDYIREAALILSEMGLTALKGGVKLSLHPHFDNPVMHRRDIDTFWSAAAPGTVGLTLDTAHMVKSGIRNIDQVILDHKDVLDNTHIKDYGMGRFCALGTGTIDFAPIFAALETVGYSGPLCADEESGDGVATGLALSSAFMCSQIDALSAKSAQIQRRGQGLDIKFPWGHIEWLVSGAQKNSTVMTFGRVTIKSGQANSVHRHPNCDEILHVLKGRILHLTGEQRFEMNVGDTISIPRGVWHNAETLSDVDAEMTIAFYTADRQTEDRAEPS